MPCALVGSYPVLGFHEVLFSYGVFIYVGLWDTGSGWGAPWLPCSIECVTIALFLLACDRQTDRNAVAVSQCLCLCYFDA